MYDSFRKGPPTKAPIATLGFGDSDSSHLNPSVQPVLALAGIEDPCGVHTKDSYCRNQQDSSSPLDFCLTNNPPERIFNQGENYQSSLGTQVDIFSQIYQEVS